MFDIRRSTDPERARASRHCYSARFAGGIWGRCGLAQRIARVALAAALPLTAGGCSFSYKLDSLFGSDKEASSGDPARSMTAAAPAAALGPTDADLALAKAAASEAVTRSGKDSSVPWENPETGARGTVTALAATYSQNGATCREFLASYVRDSNETWLAGEACRLEEGKWEVRTLRPWKRS